MSENCKIAPEKLAEMYKYDPDTGFIYALPRKPEMFEKSGRYSRNALCKQWNGRFSEKRAFYTERKNGYLAGGVLGHTLSAHRVAWCLYYGRWPKENMMIDHINRNKQDNRICNLREVDASANVRNSKIRLNNTSGVRGVSKSRSGKWTVSVAGKHIGTFDSLSDAAKARAFAENRVWGPVA